MVRPSYLSALRKTIGSARLMVPAVAAIIRRDDGAILLQRRADTGNWSLPAGAIEPGETPSQALLREVLEETGMEVAVDSIAAVIGGHAGRVTYPNGDRVEYVVTLFNCGLLDRQTTDHDAETVALDWFAPDRLPALTPAYPAELFIEPVAARWN